MMSLAWNVKAWWALLVRLPRHITQYARLIYRLLSLTPSAGVVAKACCANLL